MLPEARAYLHDIDQATVLIDGHYHQVIKAGGSRWDTSSLIHNLQLLD